MFASLRVCCQTNSSKFLLRFFICKIKPEQVWVSQQQPLIILMAIMESNSSTVLLYPLWLAILIPQGIPESSSSRTLQSSRVSLKPTMKLPQSSRTTPPQAALPLFLRTAPSVFTLNQPLVGGFQTSRIPLIVALEVIQEPQMDIAGPEEIMLVLTDRRTDNPPMMLIENNVNPIKTRGFQSPNRKNSASDFIISHIFR